MAARGSEPEASTAEEFVLERSFDAPREVVFEAWTRPEALARWWGPKGYTTRVVKLDPRPGGVFLYEMRAAGGHEMWGKFVYREVVAPERMVFVLSFSDAREGVTRHPLA